MEHFNRDFDFSQIKAEASLPGNYRLKIELLTSAVKERQSSVTFSMTRGGSITSEPIIIDGIVYIAVCDHNVYAIDLETGEELWRFSSEGPNVSGVVHDDNRLYFGSYDGNLYALSMKGKLLWKFDAGNKITGRPLVHKGRVYFGDESGTIYAVDPDGTLAWKFRTEGPIGNTCGARDNVVYFGSFDFNIYAIRADGKLLWKFAAGGEAGSPAIGKDTVYFGSIDHNIYALDMKGRLRWKFRIGDAFDPGSGIRTEGDTIYLGSKDYNMYAIREGKVVWKFPTENMIFSQPVISGNRVFFGSTDSNLYAVDKTTGKEMWRFGAAGPALYVEKSGKRIVFGCHDCNLYCVSDSGKLLWKFHTSMDYPSDIEPETRIEHSFVIPSAVAEEERKGEQKMERKPISDYGDFRSTYMGESMRDYLGSSIDKGGLSMVYKRKRDIYK